MIVDCPKCGLSYDLSGYKAGQRLRCRCGQVVVVPGAGHETRQARTLHCSNCGGLLKKGRPDCPYCSAMVDLTSARLTAYCSSCLAMSKAGAQFCSECGKPLVAAVDSPEEADQQCPRCSVKMRRRVVGTHKPLECPVCCGLFVGGEAFQGMVKEQGDRFGRDTGDPHSRAERSTLAGGPVMYVKCPFCQTVMNRMNYGRVSGVIVDYCSDHGYWLDAGELEKIARWVATGGLAEKYARDLEQLKAEKLRIAATQEVEGMYKPFTTYRDDGFEDRRGGFDVFGAFFSLFD